MEFRGGSEADGVIEVCLSMDGLGRREGILYEMRETDVEHACNTAIRRQA